MLAPTIHHNYLGRDVRAGQAWQRGWLITLGLVLGVGSPAAIAGESPTAVANDPCLSLGSSESYWASCDRPDKSHKPSPFAIAPTAPLSPSVNRDLPELLGSLAAPETTLSSVQTVEVAPEIIDSSPVLRRWLEEVPDVSVDIQHDPAFRTRVRVGYSQFPSTDQTGGVYVGIQDVFVGRTPLTLSAEYSVNSTGDRELIGADAQYYLLPLGWYGNVAPVLGYRAVNNSSFASEGINVGLRIILIPSRTGAADLSLTQSWVAPGTEEEVGLTTFSAGYAVTEDLRIGTDIQTQNSRNRQESRVSVLLEWML